MTPAPAYATASSWVRESAPLGLPPLPPLLSPSLLSLPCVRWCAHAANAWRVGNPTQLKKGAIKTDTIERELAALREHDPVRPVLLEERSAGLKTSAWAQKLADADGFELRTDLNEGLLLHGVRLPQGHTDPTVRGRPPAPGSAPDTHIRLRTRRCTRRCAHTRHRLHPSDHAPPAPVAAPGTACAPVAAPGTATLHPSLHPPLLPLLPSLHLPLLPLLRPVAAPAAATCAVGAAQHPLVRAGPKVLPTRRVGGRCRLRRRGLFRRGLRQGRPVS